MLFFGRADRHILSGLVFVGALSVAADATTQVVQWLWVAMGSEGSFSGNELEAHSRNSPEDASGLSRPCKKEVMLKKPSDDSNRACKRKIPAATKRKSKKFFDC